MTDLTVIYAKGYNQLVNKISRVVSKNNLNNDEKVTLLQIFKVPPDPNVATN